MKKFLWISSLLLISFTASAEMVTLKCVENKTSLRFYALDVDNLKAKRLEAEDVHVGKLSIFENRYELDFPKNNLYWGSHVIINRYTGDFSAESGEPPWGVITSTSGNLFASGKCTKGAKRLF